MPSIIMHNLVSCWKFPSSQLLNFCVSPIRRYLYDLSAVPLVPRYNAQRNINVSTRGLV